MSQSKVLFTKDMLIKLTCFCDIYTISNLLKSCKTYYSYKYILREYYEYNYKCVLLLSKFSRFDNNKLNSYDIIHISNCISLISIDNGSKLDPSDEKYCIDLSHGDIKYKDIQNVIQNNKKLSYLSEKDLIHLELSIYRFICYRLNLVISLCHVPRYTIKHIIFKSKYDPLLIIRYPLNVKNIPSLSDIQCYDLIIDFYEIYLYFIDPEKYKHKYTININNQNDKITNVTNNVTNNVFQSSIILIGIYFLGKYIYNKIYK